MSSNLVLSLLLLILLCCVQKCAGSEMESQPTKKQQIQNLRKNARSTIHDILHLSKPSASKNNSVVTDNDRYIVTYKNEDGRQVALQVAKNVVHEFDGIRHVVIELDVDGLKILQANSNITNIDEDSVWSEQGIQERVLTQEEMDAFMANDTSGFYYHRNLQKGETIPYGIEMVQANLINYGSTRAMVCIVDTGVAAGHPDLNQGLLSGASRTSMADGKVLLWNKDVRGHGTHIAGTVAARINNQYGVRGMGAIPLYITRGLSDTGNARESDIQQSMQQCVNAGARIISLSLSGSGISKSMREFIDKLYAMNILIVAASGNDGQRLQTYPASLPTVVSVGAVQQGETIWPKSNYGPWLEITAPGASILSTGFAASGYSFTLYSGTSMATPHIAGAAAILWSHFPACSNTQIRYAMAYTAKDKGRSGCDESFGFGIVQVKRAYDFLRTYPCRHAKWGQNVGDGTCSAIDVRPY